MDGTTQQQGHGQSVRVDTGAATLEGILSVSDGATGLVLFAHGSGSGRLSGRNRLVADALRQAGFGTLLIDLLTEDEAAVDAQTREHRFDVRLLADRVGGAIEWILRNPGTHELPIGLFGASTGAAAALVAAAEHGGIAAVVSRGGRPDLAGDALDEVDAPVLLIVGGNDEPVIDLNQQALGRLARARAKDIALIPGATHLFEEPGALDEVARLAVGWFTDHLKPSTGDIRRVPR